MRDMREIKGDINYVLECVDLLCDQFSGWRYRSIVGIERCWRPPMDVYETDDALFIVCEIAGVSEADYQVTFEGKTVTIRGARNEYCLRNKTAYHCMEINYCVFERNFHIPENVNPEAREVSYHDGFLEIKLLKKKRFRNIPIE